MAINLERLLKLNTYTVSLLIYLLVFTSISITYSFAFIPLFIFAAYRDFFKPVEIPRIFLNITAIVIVVIMAIRIDLSDLVTPVVETLLLLLALKLLEEKKFRDYMQVYLLITLIFAGYSLLSISLLFMVYLVLYLFLLNFSIIVLTYYNEDKNISLTSYQLRTIFTKSSVIPLLSIPLTFMFFLLIPRTNYPLLNILPAQSKGKTGFSDKISLGDVSSIQEDNETVMRVNMENIGEIYIRGTTFNSFDGKSWKNTLPDSLILSRDFQQQMVLRYTAYLEPTYDTYIFTVDVPVQIDLGKFNKDYYPYTKKDLTIITTIPINSRIMYSGKSAITDRYRENTPLGYYLTTPKNLSPDVVSFAKKFNGDKPIKIATNIIKELQKFEYSLTDLPAGENQLEKFLFIKKKGNCEYFATAMAVMLRINGIPSRVVGGYKTSAYNQIGKYYLVKQKDAHLWVEAYIDGYWIRFDPTPPARNTVINTIEKPSKIKLLIDSINYYYNAFIINYDFSKQMVLYTGIKERFSKFSKLDFNISKQYLIMLTPLIVFGFTVYVLHLLYRHIKTTYERRITERFLKKMKKYGYKKREAEGLEEFCSKIDDEVLREKAMKVVAEIEPYLYANRKLDKQQYLRLKQEIEKL